MPTWCFRGLSFAETRADDTAYLDRALKDGVRLRATVTLRDGRPSVTEMRVTFPDGARDFGREVAISELEAAVNDLDRHQTLRGSGEPFPILTLSGFPLGVPVRGSRGRRRQWTPRRLAELIHDLEHNNVEHWRLERNTIRQRANHAATLGIAEEVPGRPRSAKAWRLTAHGRALLDARDAA